MISVALVGPDGTGKTTIAQGVAAALPVAGRYLYMGDNPSAANRSLPTTRVWKRLTRAAGRAERTGPPPPPPTSLRRLGGPRRVVLEARSLIRLVPQLSEEWYRVAVCRSWRRRGYVVVRDRDFFVDYYRHDVAGPAAGRTLGRSLHGRLLVSVYPRPDLVIYLDAPPSVALARKGEGSVADLARRADDYREVSSVVERFVVVDATKPIADVVTEVCEQIMAYLWARERKRRR